MLESFRQFSHLPWSQFVQFSKAQFIQLEMAHQALRRHGVTAIHDAFKEAEEQRIDTPLKDRFKGNPFSNQLITELEDVNRQNTVNTTLTILQRATTFYTLLFKKSKSGKGNN